MENFSTTLIEDRYLRQGQESLQQWNQIIQQLLQTRQIPLHGLSPLCIQLLLQQLSLMDTNNNNYRRDVGEIEGSCSSSEEEEEEEEESTHPKTGKKKKRKKENKLNTKLSIGAGEREGRVLSSLVASRHFYLSHGVGRSGDINVSQPKAGGSSLLYQLTNALCLDLLKRVAGTQSMERVLVLPLATGMSLALVLRALAKNRNRSLDFQRQQQQKEKDETSQKEEKETFTSSFMPLKAQYVIWPRIDQKTALKCIDTVGLTAVPVELRPAPLSRETRLKWEAQSSTMSTKTTTKTKKTQEDNDNTPPPSPPQQQHHHPYFLQCDVNDIEHLLTHTLHPSSVVCLLSTTSCFSPRLPDDIYRLSQLCWKYQIPHVVNNAYGIQSDTNIMRKVDHIQHQYRCSLQKLESKLASYHHTTHKDTSSVDPSVEKKELDAIYQSIDGTRLDVLVQSTDKNVLVPVGGAIVATCLPYSYSSPSSSSASPPLKKSVPNIEKLVSDHFSLYNHILFDVSNIYAGRASASPVLDVFITLLEAGSLRWKSLWEKRHVLFDELKCELEKFALERGEYVVEEDMLYLDTKEQEENDDGSGIISKTNFNINNNNHHNNNSNSNKKGKQSKEIPRNDISLAITMRNYRDPKLKKKNENENVEESYNNAEDVKRFGAKLFRSAVTGPRVVVPVHLMHQQQHHHHHRNASPTSTTPPPPPPTVISGHRFYNYGTHRDGGGRESGENTQEGGLAEKEKAAVSAAATPLLVMACAIGMEREEITLLMQRLRKLWQIDGKKEEEK